MTGESWPIKGPGEDGPGKSVSLEGKSTEVELVAGFESCGSLPFGPSLKEVAPTTQAASTPTGLDVDVKCPSSDTGRPKRWPRPTCKAATVTLPEGMLLNPSAANGLQACSEAQIGFEGRRHGHRSPLAEGAVEPLQVLRAPEAQCPPASKVGTVTHQDAAA